ADQRIWQDRVGSSSNQVGHGLERQLIAAGRSAELDALTDEFDRRSLNSRNTIEYQVGRARRRSSLLNRRVTQTQRQSAERLFGRLSVRTRIDRERTAVGCESNPWIKPRHATLAHRRIDDPGIDNRGQAIVVGDDEREGVAAGKRRR